MCVLREKIWDFIEVCWHFSSAMDLQTIVIFIAFVILSLFVLLAFSALAMKEKTYEEALAEQNKQKSNVLMTIYPPRKMRGKKEKKKAKKVN